MRLSPVGEMYGRGDACQVADTILGLMPDTGVLIVDVDLHVVLMEGAVFPLHGYEPGLVEGRSVRDLPPPVAWAGIGEHWEASLAGEYRTIENASVDGLGVYWLHFAPLTTEHGLTVGAVLVAQDITARARERDSLKRRLTQQLGVSALGSLGLRQVELSALLQEAARRV
jgi:PAS domain-containing protein